MINLLLKDDENVPDMPLTESEVNHLRRVLAWLRCEYMLDESMQKGYVRGLESSVQLGYSNPEQAGNMLQKKANQINQVPAYVRQGVRMLTKAVQKHDSKSIVEN